MQGSTHKVRSLEALREAARGGADHIHLELGPGRHALRAPLRLHAVRVTLQGAGQGQTWLEGTAAPALLQLQGQRLELRDLSLRLLRGNSDILCLKEGQAHLERCGLHGSGLIGTAPSGMLAAIRLQGAAELFLRGCTLEGCRYGVLAQQTSQVQARDSTFKGLRSAISLHDRAHLEARGLHLEDNHYGVNADGHSSLALRGGHFGPHRVASVAIYGDVTGQIEGCRLEGGPLGTLLSQHTQVALLDNDLSGFHEAAIQCSRHATPLISGNRLHHSALGIWVRNGAAPRVEGNTLRQHAQAHVRVQNDAGGHFHNNTLEGGPLGVDIQHLGAPELTQNHLLDLETGVDLQQQARPILASNHFARCQVGLRLGGATGATLHMNQFTDTPEPMQALQEGQVQGGHAPLARSAPPAMTPRALEDPWAMLRAPRVKLWLSVTSTPALLLSLLWASSGGWTLALGLPLLILALGAVVARHQVALLRDGLLVYASVTEINQARQTLTLEYQGPYGDPIEIHEPLLGLPQPHQLLGQRLPVLVNPQNFKDRLVPAFYPISFKAPRLVGDTAGRLPAPVASAAQEPPDWETSLWPALPPRLRGDPLARLGVAEPIEGSLRHQAQRLIHRWGHGDPLELDLGQPFSVDLSCSPRGPRRVAVNLRLRGKRAGVDQAALCVRSVLPQSCVRAEVPRKEEAGPWLEEADFWRLWRALGFYAQVHGVEAQRMKQLQAPGHGAT